jgi:hypothetical protein
VEPLPRRAYNRRLWRRAATGIGWKAHVLSVLVSLLPAAIRVVRSGRPPESEWPLLAGVALATLVVVEVAIFCYRRLSAAPHELYLEELQRNSERDSEVAALRAQVQKQPTPRVVLTYTVESLKGLEDEVSNPPILLHNEGNTAALEAQVEAVQLSPLITVTFATAQRIATHETATIMPRVEIRTESGGWELDHNDKHFGLAIQRAHVELAHRNVKTQHGSRRWPMTVRFLDADGLAYSQHYELVLHVPTMKAWTAFVPAR